MPTGSKRGAAELVEVPSDDQRHHRDGQHAGQPPPEGAAGDATAADIADIAHAAGAGRNSTASAVRASDALAGLASNALGRRCSPMLCAIARPHSGQFAVFGRPRRM
jgi:hypothetical protein